MSSPASHFKNINSSVLSLLYGSTLTPVHDYWRNYSFDCVELSSAGILEPKKINSATISTFSPSKGNCAVLCLVTQLCLTLFDPKDCSPPGSSVHGDSPGKNTGVGCHALLQGSFPTQGLNPGLLHCRRILYQLSHGGSP